MFSANSLIDLESARSSLLVTTSWFPETSLTSFRAASAFSVSLQAIMIRAPKDKTEESQKDNNFPYDNYINIKLYRNRVAYLSLPGQWLSLCQFQC